MPSNETDESSTEAISRLVTAFCEEEDFNTAGSDKWVTWMALAWMIRMTRTAEAIVVLYRGGFSAEAAPLVRSVMEHAMRLAWLVDKRADALAAIEFDHLRYQRLLQESLEQGDWALEEADDLDETPDQLEATPDEAPEPTPEEWRRRKTFKALLEHYEVGHWYAAYRVESALSHPTYLSGAVYLFGPDDGGEIGELRHEPRLPGTPLGATATMLTLASMELVKLLRDADRYAAVVSAVAADLGLLGDP